MRRFKYVIQLLLALIFIGVILLINGRYKNLEEEAILQNIEISISNGDLYSFIYEEDILEEIDRLFIVKNETRINDIPLSALEDNIKKNPYVRRAEVYSDVLGTLHVDVQQFVPKLRFIDSDGLSYFVDRNSYVVSQNNSYIFNIPIVTQLGEVIPIRSLLRSEKEEIDSLRKQNSKVIEHLAYITDFADFMSKDSVCSALFSQISISQIGDVELIPRIGEHYVIFSSLDSLVNYRKGVDKLLKFYESQSDKGVWLDYGVVNIKYSGQVVCKGISKK